MPRYHFNILDGIELPDTVGTEMADMAEAKAESIKLAGELLKQQSTGSILGKEWRLETTDERGLILFRIDIMLSETPASSHPPQPDHSHVHHRHERHEGAGRHESDQARDHDASSVSGP